MLTHMDAADCREHRNVATVNRSNFRCFTNSETVPPKRGQVLLLPNCSATHPAPTLTKVYVATWYALRIPGQLLRRVMPAQTYPCLRCSCHGVLIQDPGLGGIVHPAV